MLHQGVVLGSKKNYFLRFPDLHRAEAVLRTAILSYTLHGKLHFCGDVSEFKVLHGSSLIPRKTPRPQNRGLLEGQIHYTVYVQISMSCTYMYMK